MVWLPWCSAGGTFPAQSRRESGLDEESIGAGLSAIVFLTYFILGLAGFRISAGGDVKVPRVYAWLLVASLTVLTLVGMALIAILSKE